MKTCEGCEKTGNLILMPCGGGAAGDVYFCRGCYAEHLRDCEICESRVYDGPDLDCYLEGRPDYFATHTVFGALK